MDSPAKKQKESIGPNPSISQGPFQYPVDATKIGMKDSPTSQKEIRETLCAMSLLATVVLISTMSDPKR